VNLDTFEKFNLRLIEENILDFERNSESERVSLSFPQRDVCC